MSTVESDPPRNTFWARERGAMLCIGLTIAVQAIMTVNVLYAASLQSAVGVHTTLRPTMPRPVAEPAGGPAAAAPADVGIVQDYQYQMTW